MRHQRPTFAATAHALVAFLFGNAMRNPITAILTHFFASRIEPLCDFHFAVLCDGIPAKVSTMNISVTRNHGPINLKATWRAADQEVEAPLSPAAWSAIVPGTTDVSPLVALQVAPDGLTAIATLSGQSGAATIIAVADGVTITADLIIAPLPIVSGEITSDVGAAPAPSVDPVVSTS